MKSQLTSASQLPARSASQLPARKENHMKPLLSSLLIWPLFLGGLVACAGARFIVHGAQHQHLVTLAGVGLSLAAGSVVMRREPLRSWLRTRPVLWFLFLFNLGVAVAVSFLVHGTQGIMAAAGMGVVALGAGVGLLRRRAVQA
jgi:hypothetical protein